jgi:formylglycine-generating enzyme required for sulfatase activity
MGSNPSQHAACGEACPVEMVSWNDAQEFLARLNAKGGAQGPPGPYRLPTEAEWEYAARSGGKHEKYAGTTDDVGSVAWFLWNTEVTQPVGQKAPNGLGLHDMTGNVWEWTADWYSETAYAGSLRKNPVGPAAGERRVLRGGSYANEAYDVRATYRNYLPPDYRGAGKGLRVVKAPPPQPK